MIRTFEEYTDKITDEEYSYVVPAVISALSLAIGAEKAITNAEIVADINLRGYFYNIIEDNNARVKHVKTSGPRIRHIIHVLRVSDTIPFLVASSKGYYISNDRNEIEEYIGSIDDRLRSIYQIRKALRRQLKNRVTSDNPKQGQLIF